MTLPLQQRQGQTLRKSQNSQALSLGTSKGVPSLTQTHNSITFIMYLIFNISP